MSTTDTAAHIPGRHHPGRRADRGPDQRPGRRDPGARLNAALVRLDGQMARIDGKAATLLTLAAALAGASLTVVSVVSVGRTLPAAAAVPAWAAAAALVAATAVLLRVVRPAFGSGTGFPRWSTRTAPQLLEDFTAGSGAGDAEGGDGGGLDAAAELVTLARLAMTKYRRIRWAVDLVTAGLGLAVLAAVAAAVAR